MTVTDARNQVEAHTQHVDEYGETNIQYCDDERCREVVGILVGCDEECLAAEEPDRTNLEEVLRTMDHYQTHTWLSGCSHGC